VLVSPQTLHGVYCRSVDSSPDSKLDLQAAADELGVHYQTAYHWVRSGRLDAEMVGGRYLVSQADISELDRRRHAPMTPSAPRPVRLEHAADRMYDALVNGEETEAVKIARRLTEEGAPIADLIQNVLVPPLRRIGQGWRSGELTIWIEHRASSIVERLLGGLAPNPRGRRRGVAVVAAVAGDRHSLPTTMAAVTLRGDHWHVHHLGADLPPDQISVFCKDHDVDLAVITVTNPESRPLAEATAFELRAAGTSTIVGGAGNTLVELTELARNAGNRLA